MYGLFYNRKRNKQVLIKRCLMNFSTSEIRRRKRGDEVFFVSFSQRPAKRNNLYKLNLIGAVKFFEGRRGEKGNKNG